MQQPLDLTDAPAQLAQRGDRVRFMMARDQKQSAAFARGIREGLDEETSLQRSFRAALDDLVKAYVRSIGVPDLRH